MATLKRKGSEGFEFVQMVGSDIVERFDSHLAETTIHKTSQTVREESETPLRMEVVSSVDSLSPTEGRLVFETSTGKPKVGNGSAWV